jgi:copper chaperone CopZ
MAKQQLRKHSHGVVHRGKNRTRLRVPRKYRSHESMAAMQKRLETIPGVESVVINSQTGSVLVHHQESADLLEQIGDALQESAPDILASMLVPGGGELEAGLGVIAALAKNFLSDAKLTPVSNNGGHAAEHSLSAGNVTARRAIPLALIGAGLWKMWQEEALLGSLAPLALLYYGWDMHWKFKLDERTTELEHLAESQAPYAEPAKEMKKVSR